MPRLPKFLRLTRIDQRLLVTALLLLARFSLELRCRRKYPWQELLAIRPSANAPRTRAPVRICWAVEAASRCVPGATCLIQSLAALKMLQREGYSARLRLGANFQDQKLSAHAWVETEGKTLLVTTNASLFVPLKC